MDFYDAVSSRFSVRRYSGKAVEADKIARIFEAVRLSPSWSNKQCWRFVVVDDPAAKMRLSELSSSGSILGSLGYKSNPARKALAEAPLVVAAFAMPGLSGNVRSQEYYLVDMGIAAQTMMLAASAEGLSTVFVGVFDEAGVKELLGIPDDARVVGLFPLGYALEEKTSRPQRASIEDIVHFGKWQD